MKASRIVLGLALTAGLLAIPQTTVAQEGGANQLVEMRRQVTEAQAVVTAAKLEMDKARARIAILFKTQNPDYAKAEADAAKAKLEIEQSKAAALTTVRAKPEYMAAVNAKIAVQAKMREMQGASDAQFNSLAEQSIKHATTISQMERSAIEQDPKYNDAVARLAEANRVVEGFASQIDEAAAVDPDYIALAQQHLAAQEGVAAANEAMKQAVLADRQARAEAARAKAAERSNKEK